MKIAAAIAIAAAGFGGGMAYKKFRAYLRKKDKQRDAGRKKPASMPDKQQPASAMGKPSATQKQPRTRKRSATKTKRNRGKGISEIEGKAARAAAKE